MTQLGRVDERIGRPATAGLDSEEFLRKRFDLSTGALRTERSGRIWQAIRTAHGTRSRGAGKIVAVVDVGFDPSLIPQDRIHPASSFPEFDPANAFGRHGTTVALLVLAAAPEAHLLLLDVHDGNGLGLDKAARAVDAAVECGASVINISAEFETNARPRAIGWIEPEIFYEFDPDPTRFSAQVGLWIENREPYSDPRCQWECRLCVAVARAAVSTAVVAAAGNVHPAACPACVAGALGAGFHHSQTVVSDGNLTAQYGFAETRVENPLLSEFTVEEPPGFLGTSFASPLLAGLAALLPNPTDMSHMASLAFAATPVQNLALLYREHRTEAPQRTISTLRSVFQQLANAALPSHQHWKQDLVQPCALCALLADIYDNAVSVLFLSGAADDALRLGKIAAAVAPLSAATASNLGLALELYADNVDPAGREAALRSAREEFERAIRVVIEEHQGADDFEDQGDDAKVRREASLSLYRSLRDRVARELEIQYG